MIDEKQARETYIKLNVIEKHAKQLEEHIDELDGKTVELREMIGAVQGIRETDGETILIPITNGIFARATLEKTDKLYLNVGAKTIVSRTPEQAEQMLTSQQEELAQYRKQLKMQQAQINAQIEQMKNSIAGQLEDVQ